MNTQIFDELSEVQDIVAYNNGDDISPFTKSINSNHVLLDLSVSDELRERFIEHYNVKSLPVLVTEATCLYNAEDVERHVHEKIKRLISGNTVFIKGTLRAPRCGYTRQLGELLQEMGENNVVEFDILSDERVRQRLKELNQWPTFPQVYLDGVFCGGLDVLKKMARKC